MMDEKKYLDRLILAIENKVGRGPVSEWTNHYFFLLSCDIEDKTGHRISESTLKRILGKKRSANGFYNPQVQTKNILANFIDYPNWHSFKNDGYLKRNPEIKDSAINISESPALNIKLLLLFILPLLAIILIILLDKKDESIVFNIENKDNNVPYTAIFNYDLSHTRDSVFIDFGNYEKFYLDPSRNIITEYYRSAAVPNVRVYTKDRALVSLKLHNNSNEWQVGSSPNDTIIAYRPFEPQPQFISGDTLFLYEQERIKQGFIFDDPRWIEYRKTSTFGLSLDSIKFSCSIKNSIEIGGKRCFDGEILLYGSKNNIRLRFMEPGCSRYALIQVSEQSHNGRFENLDKFEVDLSGWTKVGIITKDKEARILLNDKIIFEEVYSNQLGDMWGIVLRFYGNGAAHSIHYSEN